jgi:hypothetical protein
VPQKALVELLEPGTRRGAELVPQEASKLRDAHPEMVGKVSDDDLLAMAEEV